jgi:NADPH-dependent ferric siderophore reductase
MALTPETSLARPDTEARAENESLAERLGIRALSLRVVATSELTPSFRRIVVGGDDLADLDPEPGQDVMVSLGTEGARTRRRRYTIRHFDPANRTVDLDIALHGDGPGVRWATTVETGADVEAIGPRGRVGLHPGASWHLFIGDDSFAPAALNMGEAVPEDEVVVLAIEIDGRGHEQPHAISASILGEPWVLRGSAPLGDPASLLDALRTLELPDGPGHAYVGGEHAVVSALREALLERGLDEDSISAKPYWRLGRRNGTHGEPERD